MQVKGPQLELQDDFMGTGGVHDKLRVQEVHKKVSHFLRLSHADLVHFSLFSSLPVDVKFWVVHH